MAVPNGTNHSKINGDSNAGEGRLQLAQRESSLTNGTSNGAGNQLSRDNNSPPSSFSMPKHNGVGDRGANGNGLADFFSPEVFQIVLHNPTTAHRLLKFSQARMCGENMEFLEKVRWSCLRKNHDTHNVLTGLQYIGGSLHCPIGRIDYYYDGYTLLIYFKRGTKTTGCPRADAKTNQWRY